MGLLHGLYCLGCCWALFSVMVAAAEMMSIAWMLAMTLVVFAEKVLRHGLRISVVVALGLIALGLLVGSGALQLGAMPRDRISVSETSVIATNRTPETSAIWPLWGAIPGAPHF